MPVLRSREIPSPPPPKPSSSSSSKAKTLIDGISIDIEPSTPAKLIEPLDSTRTPGSSNSSSVSTRRRSFRLPSMSSPIEVGLTRKRGRVRKSDEVLNGGKTQLSLEDSQIMTHNGLAGLDSARVFDYHEENESSVNDGARVCESDDDFETRVGVRRKKEKGEIEYLSLRSGVKLLKRTLEGSNGDMLVMEVESEVVKDKGKSVLVDGDNSVAKRRLDEDNASESRRFTQEEKGKGKLVDDDCAFNTVEDMLKPTLGLGLDIDLNTPQKGDQSMVEGVAMDNIASDAVNVLEDVALESEYVALLLKNVALQSENVALQLENEALQSEYVALQSENVVMQEDKPNNTRLDQFKKIARRNAHRYAYFDAREGEASLANVEAEPVEPLEEPVAANVEDWPGPFCTAMKIIRDREKNMNVQLQNLCSGKGSFPLVLWTPRKERDSDWATRVAPSLQELCLGILAKNVDAITSLQYVPDVLRHKLSQSLCDSRRMNGHFLKLLLEGSPSELRLADCSWLEEEEFEKSFGGCDTSNLAVLQLDLCGHCVSDSSLHNALLQKGLPALTAISLKGACRISDAGLSALVSSACALRSMNLSQCSLLTDVGITNLANTLGPDLRELYLDDCESINALSILPALKRLKGLEVLSVRGIGSVSDKFIKELIESNGQNLKELILANCSQLTDSSLKVIGEFCSQLCVLDLSHLNKLTDNGMAHLANGCRGIQDLKLCRNAFSDDAVAAFLETSGASLKELSLNNISKVGQNTTISLARLCKNLERLDLSWCRRLTDEALGLIADSCLSLRVLKLFGCTQVTRTFLDGHSNPHLQIIGLKLTPILVNIKRPDFQQGPLQYSGVPSF